MFFDDEDDTDADGGVVTPQGEKTMTEKMGR